MECCYFFWDITIVCSASPYIFILLYRKSHAINILSLLNFLIFLITFLDVRELCNLGCITRYYNTGSSSSDYRPVSITPIVSKIYEHLLAKRLNALAKGNNFFPSHQSDSHRGLGVYDAFLAISGRVQKTLDLGFEALKTCLILVYPLIVLITKHWDANWDSLE